MQCMVTCEEGLACRTSPFQHQSSSAGLSHILASEGPSTISTTNATTEAAADAAERAPGLADEPPDCSPQQQLWTPVWSPGVERHSSSFHRQPHSSSPMVLQDPRYGLSAEWMLFKVNTQKEMGRIAFTIGTEHDRYDVDAGGIRAITHGSRPVDPTEGAEAFKQAFVKEYGENGPHWLTTGWQEATARAHGQYKFLFVYLHSRYHQVLLLNTFIERHMALANFSKSGTLLPGGHSWNEASYSRDSDIFLIARFLWLTVARFIAQDTEVFCQQTLCNNELAQYLNSTFVCWGGDLRYPDAYKLSNRCVSSPKRETQHL